MRRLRIAVFIGPHLILFGIFLLLPTVYGFYASLTRWNLLGEPEFVGLDNYRTILLDHDSTFHEQFVNGLTNTLVFVGLTVPLLIAVPLVLAVMLSRRAQQAASLLQAVFYIPGLISVSAGAIAWVLVFNRELGPVNHLLGTDIGFLTTQPWAWSSIVTLTVWAGIGGNLVIYRAAIAGIPDELYEAAALDGAGALRTLWSVTLPSIRFPLLYTIVLTTTGAFNVFGQPLMMTKGGPVDSTTVLMMNIRELAFGSGMSVAGMASAMAVLLGLVIMAVAAFQYVLLHRSADA